MTASDLIALLKACPRACEMIGIIFKEGGRVASHAQCSIDSFVDVKGYRTACFRRWLIGACVEKCDDLGIDVQAQCTRTFMWSRGMTTRTGFATRLEAALAALESEAT